ncbi:unnamed protein product [Calypogeia fissa]
MGNSGGKVPPYEVVDHQRQQQASTSETPRPSAGSFSPPSQGLLRPTSPNRQQWAPVQQAAPPPLPNGWDFHIDPSTGYPYFYNTRTGVSQWQDPRGPGFALPDRSDATNLGQRRQVIPPWEGGPTAADPMSWPLPPGWQEQQDQATNRRYYVNYDARIISYNDPRIEIAKAYGQGPVVEGVPVHYPPPVIGRRVDETPQPFEYGQVGPPPMVSRPMGQQQGGTSYLPPPPPLMKKKHSLWSKLGYRHSRGRHGLAGFGAGLLPGAFLFGNPAIPGGIHDGESSSSSSSSDNDDDKSDEGDDLEAGGGAEEFFLLSKPNRAHEAGDGGGQGDTGSVDGGSVSGGSVGGCSVGSQEDMQALDDYGSQGAGGGGGNTSIGVGSMVGAGGTSGAAYQQSGAQQSLFGIWQGQARDAYVQAWDEGPKGGPVGGGTKFTVLDTYMKIVLVLTFLVGCYFGVFEGLLSFCVAFAGRLLVLMVKRGRMMRRQQKRSGRKFRDSVRGAFTKRGSTFVQLRMAAASQCTQIQAWFYEHLYEHPLVRMRILTEKDGAVPLYSGLPSRPREITIVTQASADRLPAIEAMAKSWGGVLCVAVHVWTQAELREVYPKLCSLHELIEGKGLCRLNICVAKEEGPLSDEQAMAALYPINAMRNVALSMATTELVFILDADFVPSAGMHESLTGDATKYAEILRMATKERQMLVVPAFEGIAQKLENLDVSQISYPKQMGELRRQWNEGSAKAFHCSHFPRGHMPTNYESFFNPSTLKLYSVQYREFYEPYTICAREVIPPFDARFRGYGLNKISHVYQCAAMGMEFSVLPQVFVWSLPHFKSQAWVYTFGGSKDPLQKLRILGLYRRFKSELQMLHESGKKKMEELILPSQLEIKVEEPLLDGHLNMYLVA